MPTFDTGNSYISQTRALFPRTEYATFSVPFEMLPGEVAPIEKSMRVFVNGTEYAWYDTTLLTLPTTQYWTYSAPTTATNGIACWGLRISMDPVGEGINDDLDLTQLAVWDGDGDLIAVDEEWFTNDDDRLSADMLDLDPTTTDRFLTEQVSTFEIAFPKKLVFGTFGWTSKGDGASGNDYCENCTVEVNTGTPDSPVWYEIGSNLTQAVGNAVSHTAGQELNSSDYPNPTNPIDLETELLTLEVQAADYGGTIPAEVTITPALTAPSDRIIILRETRQDRPWVQPIPGARAHWKDGIKHYFNQVRFIAQELCEYREVSDLLGISLMANNTNPYTGASQAQFHDGGGETLSYSTIELLEGIPGAPSDDRHQLTVESGDKADGTSTLWTPLTYSASPTVDTQYSVDASANTITIGDGGNSLDTRIRRVTKTDEYWINFDNIPPGWNSAGAVLVQKQARFILEEACFLPGFFNESPLSQSIFPRGWNWFTFVGTRTKWTVPGPIWGGGGGVFIWTNNVPQTEPTDYTLTYPVINWTTPPAEGVPTTIAVGGGGFGGVGLGGGGDDEETTTGGPVSLGPTELPPIDWPANDVPVSFGVSAKISSTTQAALEAGTWEGASAVDFSQGNAIQTEFGTHVVRIEITVLEDGVVDDGASGTFDEGAKEILYIGKKCGTTPYVVALAKKLDPNDAFTTAEASESLGCLVPTGATGQLGMWGLAAVPVTESSPANARFLDALLGSETDTGTSTSLEENVPFFGQWKQLRDLHDAADAAGVAGTYDGFSSTQWENYIDPGEAMTDFDIPAP